ncbi:MAG: hypothetical protein R2788_19695 [Saprospiraceae bacterium]
MAHTPMKRALGGTVPAEKCPYQSFVGGDGMQTAVDTRDNNIIYGGFQFDFIISGSIKKRNSECITPQRMI